MDKLSINGLPLKIITIDEDTGFADKVARELKLSGALKLDCVTFGDGENKITLRENVRKHSVYLISTENGYFDDNNQFVFHPNNYMVRRLWAIGTLHEAHCDNLVLVRPKLSYAQQDKTHGQRESLSFKYKARLFEALGLDHILTTDLHADQTEGFFKSMDHIKMHQIFADFIARRFPEEKELVSLRPDEGGKDRNVLLRKYLEQKGFKVSKTFIDKERFDVNRTRSDVIVGDVKDKCCIIYDDVVKTGGTLLDAADIAKGLGAKKVVAVCTHGYLNTRSGHKDWFLNRLQESKIDEIIMTNTRSQLLKQVLNNSFFRKKITILGIEKLIAKAILHNMKGETIREIWKKFPADELYDVLHQAEDVKINLGTSSKSS